MSKRDLKKFLLAALLYAMSAGAGLAHDSAIASKAQQIVAAWEGWVAKHNIGEASLAVSYDGEIVTAKGKEREAQTPAPIASMSKTITGICIAKLVEEDRLSFEDTLGDLVPQIESDATIASLLTQTSGYTKDVTQQPASAYPGLDKEYLEWVATEEVEEHPRGRSEPVFHYNNANYAMLGLVIATLTDETYEKACNRLVLEPAGIDSANLNPDWRIMASWGGWKISAVDFLKFAGAYFDEDTVLGESPEDFPNVALGGGASYGMGYIFREGRKGGRNFWHDGKWDSRANGKHYQFGAYFAKWDNGWAIAANHNSSALNGEHGELDMVLSRASHR